MAITKRAALRKSGVREANQRLLLNIIRQNKKTSRADIVKITGFSASSVTFIINRMIRDGLISESQCEEHAQVGRRPLILRLRPESMMTVGVELTRTGARAAMADLGGTIHRQRTVSWHPDYHVFLARVRHVVRTLTESTPAARLLGVGVSLPGTTDRMTGRILAAENLGWFDVEAGRILSEGIPARFHFANDAKLRALAEMWFCEPGEKPLENFVFLAVPQGLGTGVVIEGRLFHGASGEGAEFGHTSLFPEGRRCVCGGTGCWEEYASPRAVERLYGERCGNKRRLEQGVEEIVLLARNGDPVALDVLRETATYLGMGLANLNAAFNPEAIVVGDYLASAWDLMKDWVWESLRGRTHQRYLSHLRIFPSRHGADSTLKGALALVLSHFFAGSVAADGDGAWGAQSDSRRTA